MALLVNLPNPACCVTDNPDHLCRKRRAAHDARLQSVFNYLLAWNGNARWQRTVRRRWSTIPRPVTVHGSRVTSAQRGYGRGDSRAWRPLSDGRVMGLW